MELFVVIILAILIAVLTYKKELLSAGGALSVFIMLVTIDYFGKWQMVVLIIWAYLSLSLIDKVFEKQIEKSVDGIHEKSGKRVASQVWINGGAAVLSIILFGVTGRPSFMMGYVIAIGEAYADSLASDVGVMSHKQPIDICTFKPITNGLSGGISLLGSSASFLGVFVYTVILALINKVSGTAFVALIIISMLGCVIDSILGSKMQVKYTCSECGTITEKRIHCSKATVKCGGVSWMSNSTVNLISNVLSCVIGILCFELIPFLM